MGNVEASPTHRFAVLDRQGTRIAAAENVEDALVLSRALPAARQVVRVSDGAIIAQRGKAYFARPELKLTTLARGAA